jgi:hypothetical protein
MLAERLR